MKTSNKSQDLIDYEIKEIEKELEKLPLVKNPMINDFELDTSNEIRSNCM